MTYLPHIVNVTHHGIKGDGATDNTAAYAAMVAAYPVNTAFYWPSSAGTYRGKLVLTGSPQLYGENPLTTILESTGDTVIDWTGGLTTTSDFGTMSNFKVYGSVDMNYSTPLVNLKKLRNLDMSHVTIELNDVTGVCLSLDSSYGLSLRRCFLRGNRYGVTLDYNSFAVPTEQADSVDINARCIGPFGPCVRTASGGIDGIRFVSGTSTSIGPGPDYGFFAESTLASPTSIGDTTITVATGEGTRFASGDPICVDAGAILDQNKVASVAGDVLTLAQPLRFAHVAAVEVWSHGYGLSTGANTQDIGLIGWHTEGIPIGWLIDGGQGHYTHGSRNGSQEFIRVATSTSDLTVGPTVMAGPVQNKLIHLTARAQASALNARIHLLGPFPVITGSAALVTVDPSTALDARVYDRVDVSSGFPTTTRNVPTGSDTRVVEASTINGVEKFRRAYDGKQTWSTDTNWYRLVAGVMKSDGAIATAIATKTTTYSITTGDSIILADATTAAFTVTLPSATTRTGAYFTVKKTNSNANAVTVATTSSQTIDGVTTFTLSNQYDTITVVSDGANWMIT
jgi:hypothetical protein